MSIDLTAIVTPYGLVDPDVQNELRAHGGPYQFYAENGKWVTLHTLFEWLPNFAYRVKPEPITVTHTYDAWMMPTGWVHAGKSMQEAQPVRITFKRINGVIDPPSYRVFHR